MAPVYREVVITWKGVEYKLTPTFRLIQLIESEISIGVVISRVGRGDSPFTHMAIILEYLLQDAGCKDVTREDIFYEFTTGDLEAHEITMMSAAIVEAFMPLPKEVKKEADPLDGGEEDEQEPTPPQT